MARAPLIVVLFAPALALAPALAAGEADDPRSSPQRGAFEQSVLVERAHWPAIVRPLTGLHAAERVCAAVSADDIEILQDGQPLEVTGIGPRPLPRLHALLVDSSRSMVRQQLAGATLLDEARRAATAYVDSLPDGDTVLVASFDENLVLAGPPGVDREATRRAIAGLTAGHATALWDALYYLVLYLETLPGEKIVVLLTDGEDSSSLKEHRFESVLALARGAPDLSVFPVGIDLPAAIQRGLPTARGKLGTLARQTGGAFFEIREVGSLEPMLRRIRERLDSQVYVSYIPRLPAAGERPGEPPQAREPRLKMRLRAELPCRLIPLGPRGRGERSSPALRNRLERFPANSTACARALAAVAGAAGGPQIAGNEWRLRGTAAARSEIADNSFLCSVESRELLAGGTIDLLVEQPPLFRRKPFVQSGRLEIDMTRKPEFGPRSFALLTPALDTVRKRLAGPEDLLLYLLEAELTNPPPPDNPLERPLFMIHGQTFLELRELIGRTLFSAYPGYRALALRQVTREVEADLHALSARSPRVRDLDDERRGELRQALLVRASDQEAGRPHLPLVHWLGDVEALDAALELELRLAGDLLGESGSAGPARERALRAADSWWKLARWFPPAVEARIVTPLVPVWDRRREALGFYRFLLPRPRILQSQVATVPRRALALRALLALEEQPAALSMLRAEVGIVALEYAEVGRREFRDSGCPVAAGLPRPAERVVLVLAGSAAADRERPLRLTAYWSDEQADLLRSSMASLVCWTAEADEQSPSSLRRLAESLNEILGPGPPRDRAAAGDYGFGGVVGSAAGAAGADGSWSRPASSFSAAAFSGSISSARSSALRARSGLSRSNSTRAVARCGSGRSRESRAAWLYSRSASP